MKKKVLALALATAMSLTACGGGGQTASSSTKPSESASGSGEPASSSESPKENLPDKPVTFTYNSEVSNMDYVTTALATDHQVNANLVDGLLETDPYGKLKECLATEWSSNEDKTVWTFKLRPGVKWVTNTGEEYDDVKAEDFVTGMRHGVEFNSATSWLLQGVVKGYSEYQKSDFSDAAWEKVGVKAVDDQTVEYTLEVPTPYFASMTTYPVLYPVNKTFLEEKGEGCKLGKPNKEKCEFGAIKLDSILYNGAFTLTENTAKSQRTMTKNPAYWDAENVHLSKVTEVYDDGSDPYSVIKGFEQGVYDQASLNPSWKDYETYKKKYEGKTHFTLPNGYAFGLVFNYNRQVYDNTNYATSDDVKKATHDAIMNENFRKAVRASYDATSELAVSSPKELAQATRRNINNANDVGTLSDGTIYPQLVTEAYKELSKDTKARDLNDGADPFYNPEEAMAFIEAAKKDGVKFPVRLDMLVPKTNEYLVKKGQSMKKSINDASQGNIIIELVMRDKDTVENIAFKNDDPSKMDYDISTFTGWGPDYADPKSCVDVYSPTTGYYMTATGLDTVDKDGKILNEDLKKQLGFMDYEKYYRDADKISDDMDARYKAFAKADAYLIDRCLYIPTSMQSRGNVVSKFRPFSRPYSTYGASMEKLKGLVIEDEIVTTEEYDKAYQIFLKGGK